MRILIYGLNFQPELTGIGKYTGEMSAWLAARGHEVRVVTAPPYYPAWKVGEGHSAWRYRRHAVEGADVMRCPLWVPTVQSGARRVLHLASFAASSLPVVCWRALTWRPDVVFVIEPAIACVPGALLAARLGGARAWLHIQDFEVDAAFSLGLISSAALRRFATAMEARFMRMFDRVSTISRTMVRLAVAKGVAAERAVFFPNWVDLQAVYPDAAAGAATRERLGVPADRVVVLYSGNMGEKQGLDILVDVARRTADQPELLYVICGDGAARPRLEAAAEGLANIRFLPLQPLEQLNGLLNMADVHVLPQRADAADLVLPSKLTGMLASGRPVVATAAPATALAELVAEAGGLTCPPETPDAMAACVRALAADPVRRAEGGRQARAWAEGNLGRDVILGQVEAAMAARA